MTAAPRTVLVTGASSGIGRAAARQAAAAGDNVVLAARGQSALDETAAECAAAGAASVQVIALDVGDDAAVEACVAEVADRYGRLDAVVHCGGVVAYGRTEEVPADVFDGVLRTNLTGSVNVARHVVPLFRRQGSGTLVYVGSVIGHIGVPLMSPYVLSKWGVRALARQLQLENRDKRDVNVCYLAPGGVDTPIYDQGANYAGLAGRPPPPVASPERVAAAALRLTRRPRARRQFGLANNVMRLGFNATPAVFDLLVGPLFRLASLDRTRPVEPTEGNVLAPRDEGNQLHGDRAGSVVGLRRNVAAIAAGVRQAMAR